MSRQLVHLHAVCGLCGQSAERSQTAWNAVICELHFLLFFSVATGAIQENVGIATSTYCTFVGSFVFNRVIEWASVK